jgi:hypothetical protein
MAQGLGEKLRREGVGTDHVTVFFHTSYQVSLIRTDMPNREGRWP